MTALVTAKGRIVERYAYDAFGAGSILNSDLEHDNYTSSSDANWSFLFGCYLRDHETDLHQIRFRFFNSRLGRWLSRDLLEHLRSDQDHYSYATNCPTGAVDPWGLTPCGRDCPEGQQSCPVGGDYKPKANGCGSDDWKGHMVPNHPLFVIDFKPACDRHDICYGTCNKCKKDCDEGIYQDAVNLCTNKFGPTGAEPNDKLLGLCTILAGEYHDKVVEKGGDPYKKSQETACKYCPK